MLNQLKAKFYNKTFLLLLFIILLGIFIRLINLNKESGLWYDETLIYNYAKESFPFGILSKLYDEVHPPLYYSLIHFWMKLFGETDYVLRLFSVMFSVLTIPLIYLAGKELKSKTTGLIAASLFCVNSLLLYYSQEITVYSLLVFICTLSIYFTLKIINSPNKRYFVSLALINAVALYAHMLGGVFVVFEVFILLIYLFLKDKKNLKPFLHAQIITFAIYLPYFLFFIHQLNHAVKYIYVWEPFSYWKLAFISHEWFSPMMLNLYFADHDIYKNLIFSRFGTTNFSGSAPHFIVFGILPVIMYYFGIIKGITSSKKVLAGFILGLLILLFEVISVLNNRVVFESRFTSIVLPPFILAASYGFSELKNKWLKVFLVCSLVFLNLFYILFNPGSVLEKTRPPGCKTVVNATEKYHFDNNSTVLLTEVFIKAVKKYFHENKTEPQLFPLDYSPIVEKIFNPDYKYKNQEYLNDNRHIREFLLSDQFSKPVRNYFNDVTKNLKKGSYLEITYCDDIKSIKEIKKIASQHIILKDFEPYELLSLKIFYDLNRLANQNYKSVSIYSHNGWTVFIYKNVK